MSIDCAIWIDDLFERLIVSSIDRTIDRWIDCPFEAVDSIHQEKQSLATGVGIFRRRNVNGQESRKGDLDFQDFWTKSIALMRAKICKKIERMNNQRSQRKLQKTKRKEKLILRPAESDEIHGVR